MVFFLLKHAYLLLLVKGILPKNVNSQEIILSAEPEYIPALRNASALAHCSYKLKSSGIPTLYWYKGNINGTNEIIQWQHSDDPITGPKYSLRVNESSYFMAKVQLEIKEVTMSDTDDYICRVASSGIPSYDKSKSIFLEIGDPYPTSIVTIEVTIEVSATNITENEDVDLNCIANGWLPPTCVWKLPNSFVLTNSGSESCQLTIEKINRKYGSGTYWCNATNYGGSGFDQIYLDVKSVPEPATGVMVVSATDSELTVTWIEGEDGGHPQTFTVEYREREFRGIWNDSQAVEMPPVTLADLLPLTSYEIRIRSDNSLDASRSESITYRTEAISTPSLNINEIIAIVIGIVIGVFVALLIVIAYLLIVLWLNLRSKKTITHLGETHISLSKENDGRCLKRIKKYLVKKQVLEYRKRDSKKESEVGDADEADGGNWIEANVSRDEVDSQAVEKNPQVIDFQAKVVLTGMRPKTEYEIRVRSEIKLCRKRFVHSEPSKVTTKGGLSIQTE